MINTKEQYKEFLQQHDVVVEKDAEEKFIEILSLTMLVPIQKTFVKSIRKSGLKVLEQRGKFHIALA